MSGWSTSRCALSRSSFTLIEVLVYLSLLLFLSVGLGRFIGSLQSNWFFMRDRSEKLLSQKILLDLIRRDVMCASGRLKDWDEKNFCFVGAGGRRIRYFVRDKKAFRVDGDVQSVISLNLDSLSCRCDLDCRNRDCRNFVTGVFVECDGVCGKIKFYVHLRNGVCCG